MADAVTIENEEFISSKRASKETGYTQDYIGQLARGGAITARRISGHWYISPESLKAYKEKADEYKPTPPPPLAANSDTLSFDGREFISASRAAELTGYHQDYIGQLARGGKIPSRQLGNRWFIDREALYEHKHQKDALLAAVQAEAVGVTVVHREEEPVRAHVDSDPFFTYTSQSGHLLPETPAAGAHIDRKAAVITPVVMPKDHSAASAAIPHDVQMPVTRAHLRPVAPKESRSRLPLMAGAALTIVVILTFGYSGLREKALYALREVPSMHTQSASAGLTGSFERVISWVEHVCALHITYQRK